MLALDDAVFKAQSSLSLFVDKIALEGLGETVPLKVRLDVVDRLAKIAGLKKEEADQRKSGFTLNINFSNPALSKTLRGVTIDAPPADPVEAILDQIPAYLSAVSEGNVEDL